MNHEQAFIDAIRQEPDDDTHRLVFADWLEERGDPRGGFVRCQVRAEALERTDRARLELEEEAADLLAQHRDEWLADVADRAEAWTFRRGFIESITLSGPAFVDLPDCLFDRHPIREFHLNLEPLDRSPNDLNDLAECPHLQFAERLELVHRFLADGPVESLLASPYLTRLRGLSLNGTYVTGRWVTDLARFPVLRQIEELDLSHCPFLHDRVLRALSSSARIGSIRRLRLGATALTPFGLLALLTPHKLERLTDLEVTVLNVPALTDASRRALRELAASPVLAQLTSLALRGGSLAGERGRILFAAPLRNLRELRIVGCELDHVSASCLAEASALRGLRHLELTRTQIGPEEMVVLASSPLLERVEVLDLADNAIQGRGLTALAHSQAMRLARLNLERNGVGGPSIDALARSPLAAGLRWLSLRENYVGEVGISGLAGSSTLTGLTHLNLALNRMEAVCAEILARSTNFRHLVELDLSSNQIGDRGVEALASSPHLPRLRRLDLRHNHIGRSGVEALLQSPTLRRLDELDLRGNDLISDEKPRLVARFGGLVRVAEPG